MNLSLKVKDFFLNFDLQNLTLILESKKLSFIEENPRKLT
jgi:hypothetical protein